MKRESELLWEAYIKSTTEQPDTECQIVQEKKGTGKKPDGDGDGVPDWADKKHGEDDHTDKEEGDEESESKKDKHVKKEDTSVHHSHFGFGIVVSENTNDDGRVSWYDIQFEHGREVVNAVDLVMLDDKK